MLLPTIINVNQRGIPTLKSINVTVTTSEVQIQFNNHRVLGNPFRGLIIIDIAQSIPAGTATTLPIVFTSESGSSHNLMLSKDTQATVANVSGNKIYLVWFESQTNTLQLVTSI